MNITEQTAEDWRVRYYTGQEDHKLDVDSLRNLIPSTPEEYERKFGHKDQEHKEKGDDRDLDNMRSAAGIKIKTKAPKNEYTESLRIAAGIR